MKKSLVTLYDEIVEAARDHCVEGTVEILDIKPDVDHAKGGGYWVQAWIYVGKDL